MAREAQRDKGLDALLLMDTECLVVQEHPLWWVKLRVWEVEPTEQIPHGIRYELTLHDHHNQRVFGMDNAHAPPRPRRKKYGGNRCAWDHRHQHLGDPGSVYEFDSAEQLLIDFWAGVDDTLKAHGYLPIQ